MTKRPATTDDRTDLERAAAAREERLREIGVSEAGIALVMRKMEQRIAAIGR